MDQSKTSLSEPDSDNPFAALNHTELYQLCRKKGLGVRPTMTRGALSALLCDTGEIDEVENPVDSWRDALIAFIGNYWTSLRPQLKCPAKNLRNPDPEMVNPKPCFGCPDMQVMSCVAQQSKSNLKKLHTLRKQNT